MFAEITYDKGTLLIKGDIHVPYATFDSRVNCYRILAYKYRDIIEYFDKSGVEYVDKALDLIPSPEFEAEIELRDYQEKAVEMWLKDKRGCVVLPTGSGKTYVAIAVINEISLSTLVVVPTLDLLNQWVEKLSIFGREWVGELSGVRKEIKPITVTTYDSAYRNIENIGNKFALLIFDEVHHLPSQSYSQIAEMSVSPFRLGLTATYEREDGLHSKLPELVGGKVFEMKLDELSGKHLASYKVRRIYVPLTDEEKEIYEKNAEVFRSYLRKRGLKLRSVEDFHKVVMATGYDVEAYKALRAWDEARKVAFNSKNKLVELRKILEKHKNDKIIIFTRYNDLVYKISKLFLIPAITHRTSKDERQAILDGFRTGKYKAIVSSQVLDEGIDVPDANVAVIVSGSGSVREYIQRLGRILRPKSRRSILYEIISRDTGEVHVAKRRKIRKV